MARRRNQASPASPIRGLPAPGRPSSGRPSPGRPARDRRRELSQNFLRDPRTAERVVRAARPAPGDLVVEVGAGEGPLTLALARRCRRVVAYELDGRLAAALAARTRDRAGIEVVHGDFLAARPPREPFAVVGNIPYAATAGIVHWCLRAPRLRSATLVTQLEYARKRTGDYGRWSRLTVLTWPRFTWLLLGRIGREEFRPVPRVDSAIMRLERRAAPLLPDRLMPRWEGLVELGFTGAGGSLRASLRGRYPRRRLDAALRSAGVAPDTVVAFVTPAQWLTLFTHLEEAPGVPDANR